MQRADEDHELLQVHARRLTHSKIATPLTSRSNTYDSIKPCGTQVRLVVPAWNLLRSGLIFRGLAINARHNFA